MSRKDVLMAHSVIRIAFAVLTFGFSLSACSSTSWKEEVLLHDGRKIIVERTVERAGRHETGQEPPIKEQNLAFTMPGTTENVVWHDKFTDDIGGANFLPMLLEVSKDAAYLVVHPMGCLSYNKWGRPNPPYVVFRYQDNAWARVQLAELPGELKTPNLIFSSPDHEAKKAGKPIVSAETIRALYEGYRQPEYKSVLRSELPKTRINVMCEERVLYKGAWILPNDPVARKFIDSQKK
ncbi:MAG: hypothetical protein K9K30_01620 [Burkholderiaceae bacterium]|nr:hypothetical protein [Sulfuritalea sp.]MCF8173915.1 hypothetical protein [Burkholderiaceae bacterium]